MTLIMYCGFGRHYTFHQVADADEVALFSTSAPSGCIMVIGWEE